MISGSPLSTTALAMSARFFLTYGVNAATQFSFEIVPTTLRGQVGKQNARISFKKKKKTPYAPIV